jgi:hypothetical protein
MIPLDYGTVPTTIARALGNSVVLAVSMNAEIAQPPKTPASSRGWQTKNTVLRL